MERCKDNINSSQLTLNTNFEVLCFSFFKYVFNRNSIYADYNRNNYRNAFIYPFYIIKYSNHVDIAKIKFAKKHEKQQYEHKKHQQRQKNKKRRK